MTAPNYIRLRQLCLVAADLDQAEAELRDAFGLEISHRDDRVHKYGLLNFVMPVNSSFLEVVAPTRPGTTAGRFLERFAGAGAYMAMFDCSDFAHWRRLVEREGVRIAKYQAFPRYEHMQLHPKDTGVTMLEIHHNLGGDDPFGHYDPGGEGWQQKIRTRLVHDLLGADVETDQPSALAERWSRLLDRPVSADRNGAPVIRVDQGFVRFLGKGSDEPELMTTAHLSAPDPIAVIERSRAAGRPVEEDSVVVCGLRFKMHPLDKDPLS